jgi:hypothetical protein
VGGPIVADKLWFYGSVRRFRIDRLEANTFNPDKTQALDENIIWNATGKATWQISPKHRFSTLVDYGDKLRPHRRTTTQQYQFISPEASSLLAARRADDQRQAGLEPQPVVPARDRLRWYYVPWSLDYQPDADPGAFPRNDLTPLDPDRRLGAVDDAGLAGAPHVERRRIVPAVLARLAPGEVRAAVRARAVPPGLRLARPRRLHRALPQRRPDSVLVYNTPVRTSIDQYELGLFVAGTRGRCAG